jgi:hypothetical protein
MIRGTRRHHVFSLIGARPAASRRTVVIRAIHRHYIDPNDDADHPETAFIDRDAAVLPLRTRRPRHTCPLGRQASPLKSP